MFANVDVLGQESGIKHETHIDADITAQRPSLAMFCE